jgi:CTP synthase (UTP-ammonia lyase)
MKTNIEIGIVGDFYNSKTQIAIAEAIEHSNKKLGFTTTYQWIETLSIDSDNYKERLKGLNGIWSASGSPFKNLEGSLLAIKYARENKIPHIGTCGGYQHTIIEYARNVLGFKNAQHAEYSDDSSDLFIDKMACSLVGTKGKVKISENSFAYQIYGKSEIEVEYYCSYGLNNNYKPVMLSGDFLVSGVDINNEIRMMELKNHPFFVITAFVPQVDSSYDNPNPLVSEFVRKVNGN